MHEVSRLQHIAPFHVMEIVKQAHALQAQGRRLIHMSIGEPDFIAPEPVLQAAQQAMQQGLLQYTPALGIMPLRQALSRHYQREFGLQIDAERIVITAGASGALLLACAALVAAGKDVLMPDPSYPCNRNFVAAFEGRAKLLACGPEQQFQMTASQLAAHWDSDSAGVLLASPSNPTGTSIPESELRAILQFVAEQDGFAVVDEIYQGLSYGHAPRSALALSDQVVVINSFSKYFHMTGWRLGWMVVPPNLLPAIEKLAQNLFICPSSLAQQAALACFEEPAQTIYRTRKDEFARRRAFLLEHLPACGLDVPVAPDGAFYIYANCSRLFGRTPDGNIDNADDLSIRLMHEAGVVMVPGLDFGPSTARHWLRLSYATAFEQLQEAVANLRAYYQRHLTLQD